MARLRSFFKRIRSLRLQSDHFFKQVNAVFAGPEKSVGKGKAAEGREETGFQEAFARSCEKPDDKLIFVLAEAFGDYPAFQP